MGSLFVEMSTDELVLVDKCIALRRSLMKQLTQLCQSLAYVEMSNTQRASWDEGSERVVALLSWISMHEVKALRALRFLPGAIRFTRAQLTRCYRGLNQEVTP